MGRTKKLGLDYFPMDVDMFSDIKIRKLVRRCGGKAVAVYALLLCNIYKNGYYMLWDQELPFVISELLPGLDETYIQEVIKDCLSLGLLDQQLYDSSHILTSRGIQERYREVCITCRRRCSIDEYSLLDRGPISSEVMPISSEVMPISSEVMPISSEVMPISSEVMPISSDFLRQSKVKESKGKKRREEENGGKTAKRFHPPTLQEVNEYIIRKGYPVDAEAFIAFYESKDWYIGKNKMKDWKAALVTWTKRAPSSHTSTRTRNCNSEWE